MNRHICGMTLVELLLAAAVTVLVAGSAMMVFRGTAAAQERIDRQMALQQEARAAINAIVTALRNAYRPAGPGGSPQGAQPADSDGPLEGIDEWSGDRPADRIRLMTVGNRTIRSDQPESDVREVEFFLASSSSDRPPMLMRRTDPTLNPQPDGGGVVERIASGVIGMDIEYHDGEGWVERWPATLRAWPTVVRVRLAVASEREDVEAQGALTVSRLIGFLVASGESGSDQPAVPRSPQEPTQ